MLVRLMARAAPAYTDIMDTPLQVPLTAEQMAAVQAGNGLARIEDPTTHRIFVLIEQTAVSADRDEYYRRKIEEAYAADDVGPLDMNAIRAKILRH